MKRLLSVTAEQSPSRTRPLAGLPDFVVEGAVGMDDALYRLSSSRIDVILVHLPIPDWTPEQVLEELHRVDALAPVLVFQPGISPSQAVHLARLGVWECLGDDPAPEAVAQIAQEALNYRYARERSLTSPSAEPWKRFLVGESRAVRELEQIVRLVAARRCTVLISGETGTGKEMLARALHLASPRSRQALVSVSCTALPENLLEAELFGHVRGAFTGAVQQRVGRFEQAHRGTLFLDEVGDMPFELQAKLLRVLQEREFERLGSSETIRVDVRVLAASNADLPSLVRQGRFREDLYYRLNVVPVRLPPLRERREDIPLLVHHFVDKICRNDNLPVRSVPPEVLDRLRAYNWPGNIRELENSVEMAIAMSGDRTMLYPSDFPLNTTARDVSPHPTPAAPVLGERVDFERAVHEFEQSLLEQALAKAGGNKTMAAELLGLKRTTLLAKLRNQPTGVLASQPVLSPGKRLGRHRNSAEAQRGAVTRANSNLQDCSNNSRCTLRSSSTSF